MAGCDRSLVPVVVVSPSRQERRCGGSSACDLKAHVFWRFPTRRCVFHDASVQTRQTEAISTNALCSPSLHHLVPAGRGAGRAKNLAPAPLSLAALVCSARRGHVLVSAPDASRHATYRVARDLY